MGTDEAQVRARVRHGNGHGEAWVQVHSKVPAGYLWGTLLSRTRVITA
jgi:hypothetical protein